MNYQAFLQCVLREITRALPPTVTPKLHQVRKNNGLDLDGLVFKTVHSSLAVTVYLNPYYADYCSGTPIHRIVEEILSVYQKHSATPRFLTEDFLHYPSARKNLCLKLINRQMNQSLLKTVPCLPFQDLALVCIYLQHDEQNGCSSILITDQHLKLWKQTREAVFETAIRNAPRLLKPVIRPLNDLLFQFLQTQNALQASSSESSLQEIAALSSDPASQLPMYVLTDEYLYFGAVCMTYPDILQSFSEKLSQNLYLIPSSIHEIILVPTESANQVSRLTGLVRQVNAECLPKEDILSDHIYFYDRKKHLIQY